MMPGLVHVSGYRQRRDDLLVDVAEHHRGAPAGGGGEKKPWHGKPNETFRQKIAEAERSAEHKNDGYGQYAPSGAMGRYQLTLLALRDINWKDVDGAWTDLARKHKIDSDSAFLANSTAQEAAMTAYIDRNEEQLKANGSKDHLDKTYKGRDGMNFTVTEAGLAAAAHREGPAATRGALEKLKAKAAGNHRTFTKNEARAIKRIRDFQDVPYAKP